MLDIDESELCSDCEEVLDDPRTHCEWCGACAGSFHGYGCTEEDDSEES